MAKKVESHPPKTRRRVAYQFAASKYKAHQAFKDDCNPNQVFRRYQETGTIDPQLLNQRQQPMFGDVSKLPDLRGMMEIVLDAELQFMSLPSDLRERFHNDPRVLYGFVADDKNRAEAIELGLIPRPDPPPTPTAAPTASGGGAPPAT